MIQLIATDLDGTLLAPGGFEMPERNRLALQKAVSMGVRVVICTGRIFAGGQKHALAVPGDQPVISVNGAVVRMSRSLEYLRRVPVPEAQLAGLMGILRAAGASPWLYAGDSCYAEKETDALDNLRRRTGAHIEIARNLDAKLSERPEKILAVLPPEQAAALQKKLEDHFAGELYITRSSSTQVEILAPEATKGTALEMVASRFGIPREKVAAFGDNLNDLELFSAAGIKVAMSNGEEALKSRADIIAPENGEAGVGQIIERLLNLA